MGKNGTETNFLQWFRSWKDYKITEFDAECRDALREFKRKEYNIEDELKVLQYEPEIPITKDYWTLDADEVALLTKEADATARGYLEKSMFADWAKKQLIMNAEIKTKNDNLKKMRSELQDLSMKIDQDMKWFRKKNQEHNHKGKPYRDPQH